MISRIQFIFFLVLLANTISSQQLWVYDGLSPVATVDQEILTLQDNQKLQASVRNSPDNIGPLKFAQGIDANISIENRGTWESVEGDRSIWRMRIKSTDAYSVNLGFKDFHLPSSATMFIYDPNQAYVIGPITAADNDQHMEWWSPILPFDEVVVEVQVNTDQRDELTMDIRKVNHDFAGFGALLSGSCNVDVACDGDDGFGIIDQYRDIINSVGMYTIRGQEICSGALINTTNNDCTPYFLTAFHCEVTSNNAASVVVYWNYENSTCRQPNSVASGQVGNGPRTNFNSGSSLVSAYDVTDFTLLQLDDAVDPAFGPFYSGWNVDGEVFDTTLAIHHPRSEEKRISFDFDSSTPFADRVFMRVNNWELGTTEGGSSGCPLYNTDKQIIGQLTGGLAACGNADFDDFGMLKLSWTGGGTPTTRLRDWLDPNNTGQLEIDGRSCTSVASFSPTRIALCKLDESMAQVSIAVQSGYENGATVSVNKLPQGVMANLSSNRLDSENSITIDLDISDLAEDFEGVIVVEIDDGFSIIENDISVDFDADAPQGPELVLPADGTRDINFDINFEWGNNGSSYNLQLARNREFTDMVTAMDNIEENEIKLTGLDAATTYYWRVQSINECGMSDFSEVFTFSTGNIVCESLTYAGEVLTILTESNVVRSTISVDSDLPIADINLINIAGTHSWIADLEFRLIGPDSTVVDLLLNGCDNEDDFNISFDDESDNFVLNCPFTDGTAYRPSQELSVFDGLSAAGDWTLEITDDIFLDGGTFETWTLELCLVNEEPARSIIVSPQSIDICEKEDVTIEIEVDLNGRFDANTFITIVDDQSNPIVATREYRQEDIVSVPITSIIQSNTSSVMVIITDDTGAVTSSISVVLQTDDLQTELLSPVDQDKDVDRNPVLSWLPSRDAISHRVQLFDSVGVLLLDSTVMNIDSFEIADRLDQFTLYQWSVSAIGACSPDQSSDVYSFRTVMSVSNMDITESDILVYPNPASDHVIILKETAWQDDPVFNLYSIDGVLLKRVELISNKNTLSISDIPIGAYYYQIIDGDNRYVHKLIKAN